MKIVDVELIQLAKQLDHPHRNSKSARSRRRHLARPDHHRRGHRRPRRRLVRRRPGRGRRSRQAQAARARRGPVQRRGDLAQGVRRRRHVRPEGRRRRRHERHRHGLLGRHGQGARAAGLQADRRPQPRPRSRRTPRTCTGRRTRPTMARDAASFVERGFTMVKTHVGVDPVDDVRRVRALREAIGPDIGLMVDINTAFDRPTAIRFGRRIAEYDITWYEEPLSPVDLDGLADHPRRHRPPDRDRRERVHPLGLPRDVRQGRRGRGDAGHGPDRRHHRDEEDLRRRRGVRGRRLAAQLQQRRLLRRDAPPDGGHARHRPAGVGHGRTARSSTSCSSSR